MHDDFVIDDAAAHFAASKQADYRTRVRDRFAAFVEFLQLNRLSTRTLLEAGQVPSSDLKIMRSDLTDEGLEVVMLAYDKWLCGIDRGNPTSDTTILETALRKIRERN